MKKILKWSLISIMVVVVIYSVLPKVPDEEGQKTVTNKNEQPVATSVPKEKPFNIEVTSQIVKKVNGKYRYFFDIRNKDSKPFEGGVKISIYKSNTKMALAGDTFSTNKPIEPALGNSVFTDANTGPVSEMGENGLIDFKYEVMINKQIVKTGEGKITDKFENSN